MSNNISFAYTQSFKTHEWSIYNHVYILILKTVHGITNVTCHKPTAEKHEYHSSYMKIGLWYETTKITVEIAQKYRPVKSDAYTLNVP